MCAALPAEHPQAEASEHDDGQRRRHVVGDAAEWRPCRPGSGGGAYWRPSARTTRARGARRARRRGHRIGAGRRRGRRRGSRRRGDRRGTRPRPGWRLRPGRRPAASKRTGQSRITLRLAVVACATSRRPKNAAAATGGGRRVGHVHNIWLRNVIDASSRPWRFRAAPVIVTLGLAAPDLHRHRDSMGLQAHPVVDELSRIAPELLIKGGSFWSGCRTLTTHHAGLLTDCCLRRNDRRRASA